MSVGVPLAVRLGPFAIVVVVVAVIVVPLAFSVLGGFRSNQQLVEQPVGLPDPWIEQLHVDPHIGTVLATGRFQHPHRARGDVRRAAGCLARGFVIARFPFRGRELVFGLFTLGLLFPVAVAILPLFIVLRQAGLLSNPSAWRCRRLRSRCRSRS